MITTRGAVSRRRRGPALDPVQDYLDHHEGDKHLLLIGQPATGKSTMAKCLAARLVRSDATNACFVGVVDVKGEYARLAEALGLSQVHLFPGSPHRLNPLAAGSDAVLLGRGTVAERRLRFLAAVCQTSLGRGLTPAEHQALSAVVTQLPMSPTGPQPVVADVVRRLAGPTAEMVEFAAAEGDRCGEWVGLILPPEVVDAGRAVGRVLAQVLDGPLRGCFDAPWTLGRKGDGPGVVVDVSAFYAERAAVPVIAAMAAMAWLEGVGSQSRPGEPGEPAQRYHLVDDAWVLMRDEHACGYLDGWLDGAEADGVAAMLIAHRLDDLGRGFGDEGEKLALRYKAFVGTFGTRVVFRHSLDDIDVVRGALDLAGDEGDTIAELAQGLALWKVAEGAGIVVEHHPEADEWSFCDDARLAV